MYYHHHWVIDWNKVQTLDDLKRLVAAMNITFEPGCDVKSIEDLLKVEEKHELHWR